MSLRTQNRQTRNYILEIKTVKKLNITSQTPTGEENNLEASDLELISNLSSSTEMDLDRKEPNLRRSKRLRKTYPIIRLNNPLPSFPCPIEFPVSHAFSCTFYTQFFLSFSVLSSAVFIHHKHTRAPSDSKATCRWCLDAASWWRVRSHSN